MGWDCGRLDGWMRLISDSTRLDGILYMHEVRASA